MIGTIVVLRGLPAAGKSTYAKEWVAENPGMRARVNRDDIRMMLFGKPAGELDHADEQVVTRAEEGLVRAALKEGRDVIVDAMHLRSRYIKRWEKIAPVELVEFPSPIAECIARDTERERNVGADTIRAIAQRYGIPADGTLPLYELTPGLHLQTSPKRRGTEVNWKPAPEWDSALPDALIEAQTKMLAEENVARLQGPVTEAEVEAARQALNAADIDYSTREQLSDLGGGGMEPGDWYTFMARAALEAARGR